MVPGKLSRKPRQRLLEVGFVAVVRRLAAERLRRAAGLEKQDGLQGGRTKPASSRPAESVINRGRRHLMPRIARGRASRARRFYFGMANTSELALTLGGASQRCPY